MHSVLRTNQAAIENLLYKGANKPVTAKHTACEAMARGPQKLCRRACLTPLFSLQCLCQRHWTLTKYLQIQGGRKEMHALQKVSCHDAPWERYRLPPHLQLLNGNSLSTYLRLPFPLPRGESLLQSFPKHFFVQRKA